MVPDPVFITEILEGATLKLYPIISDDGSGDSESVIIFLHMNLIISTSRMFANGSAFSDVVCYDQ